ncbi:hypothetical protein N7462_002386 [Penicillium macrosclerotiorum]|uniref:uncharacterized protein n=1 Tax=Penicillium macrosclerotiorum TaxID=303699 RepID=UPI0025492D66|nr:uncharacterized protein N7462_002386 [Penicillium macrosclerotiorum]KAJ5692963.1 hypothetical protein N7462_002386 [Penicillium macrosclerotiorum]
MSSFQIISSLRYDPDLPTVTSQHASIYPHPAQSPYYLLAYHQQRLISAAQHFQWPKALDFLQRDLGDFEQFLDAFIPDKHKPWRLRIVVDSEGNGSVDVHPAPASSLLHFVIPSQDTDLRSPVWKVYLDTQSTTPSGFTTHKTTARNDYTAARLRAGISSPAETSEVLVVNPNGEIMEGSITTPYFRRHDTGDGGGASGPEWITPPLQSGGNAGTSRRYALSQGFCTEEVISTAQLRDGDECWLSNGVRGFMRGKVILDR